MAETSPHLTASSSRSSRARVIDLLLRIVLLVAGLWGVVVGLHALGAPGFRMLRIPLATSLAPVSVQHALDAMTAPPQRPSDPRLAGELPTRPYKPVDPFADAGPRDAINRVTAELHHDLRIEDTAFYPDGRTTPSWQTAYRRAYTPTGAAFEIESSNGGDSPGPCRNERHVILATEGVYVDDDRALVLLKERWSCGPDPGDRGRLEHDEYALRRIDGRWLIESWLDRRPIEP